MKRLNLLLLAFAGILSLASGHMLYAEFPEEISADSQVQIWITYGHDEDEQKAPDLSIARVISPDGDQSDLDLEEYEGGLLGTVEVGESGCYLLDFQMEPTLFDPEWSGFSGDASLLPKYGRALMVAESGDGYDWSTGEGLEIVPLVDPSDLSKGSSFRAEVLWNGEPYDGDYNAVVMKTPEDLLVVQHAQENEVEGYTEDGEIEFALTKPGLWVVTLEAMVEESGTWTATSDDSNGYYSEGDQLEYDQIAPTSQLTFWCH